MGGIIHSYTKCGSMFCSTKNKKVIRMIERKEEDVLKDQITVLLIIDVLLAVIIAGIFLITIPQQERPYNPCMFFGSFNATKTSDGWVIKGYAYMGKINNSTEGYYFDHKVELSHLHYSVDNHSNGHIYERGYISSIKNKTSSLGIVFYDVDNNGILSKGDYMFIPRIEENSMNHPRSGDYVIFGYDGCDCVSVVHLP